jgi:hypothetical protein
MYIVKERKVQKMTYTDEIIATLRTPVDYTPLIKKADEIKAKLDAIKAAIDAGDVSPENINEMCKLAFELGKLN